MFVAPYEDVKQLGYMYNLISMVSAEHKKAVGQEESKRSHNKSNHHAISQFNFIHSMDCPKRVRGNILKRGNWINFIIRLIRRGNVKWNEFLLKDSGFATGTI